MDGRPNRDLHRMEANLSGGERRHNNSRGKAARARFKIRVRGDNATRVAVVLLASQLLIKNF